MKAITRAYKFQEDSHEEKINKPIVENNASMPESDIQDKDDMDSVYSLVLCSNEGKTCNI